MEKQCPKCKEVKPIDQMYTNGYCKVCHSLYRKEQYIKNKSQVKEYNEANKEKIASYQHEYYAQNKNVLNQRYSDRRKVYYEQNKEVKLSKQKKYKEINIDKYKSYHKDYASKNRDKINSYAKVYMKTRRESDPEFKIKLLLRGRLNSALKYNGYRKHAKTAELLGCNILELKSYLESKFIEGMTWDNHGKLWHIDHIKPCSSFNLSLKEEQLKCFHYTNLQPLFAITTIIDGVEYIGNLNKSDKI